MFLPVSEYWNIKCFFLVPNEEYVLPDAVNILKGFLKAPCKKSRKPNSKFWNVTEVIASFFYMLQNNEIFQVFSVPN